MQYLGNINIPIWFFVFWCWTFVTQIYIHKFYCIYFHYNFFDYEYLIISKIMNKQTFIFYFNAYLSVGFSYNGKTEYNFVYVFINYFCAIVTYCTIISNLYFCSLNLKKASKKHTRVTSISFLQQVTGLSSLCMFALAHGLSGRFISCYWVSWIGFAFRPSRELVWHLSTQGNNGLLAVYINVFDPRRGKCRWFIPF